MKNGALILGSIVLVLAVVLYVVFLLDQAAAAKRKADDAVREAAIARGRADIARRQAEAERAEADRLAALNTKTEEIHAKQTEQRDKVSSGDPAADFDGSLDVLSKLSAKRRG
jgi:ABC-type protease/lipase transport system fused ATPase/permease subunit